MKVDYSKNTVPAEYKCAECGATGCKLWREYHTAVPPRNFGSFCEVQTTFSPRLLCCNCASRDQREGISGIDEKGRHLSKKRGHTCEIGWYIPAIPSEHGFSFAYYGSVTPAGFSWWERLPTKPPMSTSSQPHLSWATRLLKLKQWVIQLCKRML